MAEESYTDLLHITQHQANLLSATMRLPVNTPIDTLTRLVLKDPNFCDRLLDISFPHRRPPQITEPTIHECVRQIGIERIRFLFLSNAISSAFDNIRIDDFEPPLFWMDSFRRGFAAYELAEQLDYKDPYEAFLTGFLCDLGTLLLAVQHPKYASQLRQCRNRPGDLRIILEKIFTGESHPEAIKSSSLSTLIPPRVIEAIFNSHQPYPSEDRQAVLTCIASAADAIADIAQAVPKYVVLDTARSALGLFEQQISLEKIYTAAEMRATSLSQELGYNTPQAVSFEEVTNLNNLPEDDDFNPFDLLSTTNSHRQLENRVSYISHLADHLEKTTRERDVFSVMLIDIDHFTQLNETYGAPSADGLLQDVSRYISKNMRAVDRISHIKGDRFALLLPQTQSLGARVVAERIRSLLRSTTIAMGTILPSCTASVGGLTITIENKPDNAESLWSLLEDQLLAAKEKGRNCVNWSEAK